MVTTHKKGVMAVVTPVNRSQQTECKVICKSHLQLSLLDGLLPHLPLHCTSAFSTGGFGADWMLQ